MNPEVKVKWTTALRTGMIGDKPVAQAKHVLRRPDDGNVMQACCLGVLTEIAVAEGLDVRRSQNEQMPFEYMYYDDDNLEWASDGWALENSGELPPNVAKWAGLTETNPVVCYEREDGSKHPISVINDDTDLGFVAIADIIDEQL